MKTLSVLLAAAAIAGSSAFALAQSPPSPGDARPPGALKKGGIPPAAAMRRGDDMSPVAQPAGMKKGMHKKMKMTHTKMKTKHMKKKKMM